MSYCLYEVDKEKRIARLTFNKPEKLHAKTEEDIQETIERLQEAEQDDNVSVIILSGTGRCYGAGRDIDEVRSGRQFDKGRPSLRTRYAGLKSHWGRRGVLQQILKCDKVTISQVHGYCYGGHFEYMVASDLAVASEDAQFTHPGYTYLGIEGPIPLYVLMIGWRKTKEMMLLGKGLSAQEALEFGLVNKVVPREKLEESVNEWAEIIAQRPIDSMVMGKKEFDLAIDMMGVSAGYDLASFHHTCASNLKFEEGEFNLMKELRDRGRKGMYAARDTGLKDPLRKE